MKEMLSDDKETPQITFSRSKWGKFGDCFFIMIIFVFLFGIEYGLIITQNEPIIADSPIYGQPDDIETVSGLTLILCAILPFYILFMFDLLLFCLFDKRNKYSFILKTWLKQFFLMNRMIWFSFLINLIATEIIKYFCGSPRPYYQTAKNEFDNDLIDEFEKKNANLSFISGHASMSMNTLFLLTIMMYSAYKYVQNIYYKQINDIVIINCDNPHSYYLSAFWYLLKEIPLLSVIIIFIPTMGGIYIGLTRIVDYKHFAVDVVGGLLVGAGVAIISYSIFWNETYLAFNFKLKKKFDQIEMENYQLAPNRNEAEQTDLIDI